MGSGSSISKTEVEIIPIKDNNLNKKSLKDSSIKSRSHQNLISNSKLDDTQNKYKQIIEQNEKLKSDLDSLQKENTELINEINGLESQLHLLNNQNTNDIKEDFQKVIETKDKKIKELEDKLKLDEQNINEMRSKYEEKIKRMSSKIDSLKQQNALKVIELKDEIKELQSQNSSLNDKIQMLSETEVNNDNTKLIIELSSHIGEKDVIIMQLNGELEEKENIIISLQEELKQLKLNFKAKNYNFDSDEEVLKSSRYKNDKLSNNNRYNSAPSKSPIDLNKTVNKYNSKINVKEFAPNDVEIKKTYTVEANNTKNSTTKETVAKMIDNSDRKIRNFNFPNNIDLLNSSISSLSN